MVNFLDILEENLSMKPFISGTQQTTIYWVILLAFLGFLTGCNYPVDVSPPCDEVIEDPRPIEELVLADPVIRELNTKVKLRKPEVSPCFVDNKVSIVITYELPTSYSTYGVTYADHLSVFYSRDSTIGLAGNDVGGITVPKTYDVESILENSRERIKVIENNPRAKEVLENTVPDPANPVSYLSNWQVLRYGNQLKYNFYHEIVDEYILSNDIEWQNFPEITQSHQIIEKYLLVSDLANCQIARDEKHEYTATNFHQSNGPWFMTVQIKCEDGYKDAYVQINYDGSFERLGLK